MKFKDNIPEKLLLGTTERFVNVLEALLDFKHENMFKALRVTNPALLNNPKWLLKNLTEFGFTLSENTPIIVLQQLLLNMDRIVKAKGSKVGTEMFLSIMTLGEVILDDSQFYERISALIPNSLSNGYITDNIKDVYYLVDDTDVLRSRSPLTITIKSKFFNEDTKNAQAIKEYIEKEIVNWTGFNPGKTFTFYYEPREEFYYHKSLNKYFI